MFGKEHLPLKSWANDISQTVCETVLLKIHKHDSIKKKKKKYKNVWEIRKVKDNQPWICGLLVIIPINQSITKTQTQVS